MFCCRCLIPVSSVGVCLVLCVCFPSHVFVSLLVSRFLSLPPCFVSLLLSLCSSRCVSSLSLPRPPCLVSLNYFHVSLFVSPPFVSPVRLAPMCVPFLPAPVSSVFPVLFWQSLVLCSVCFMFITFYCFPCIIMSICPLPSLPSPCICCVCMWDFPFVLGHIVC